MTSMKRKTARVVGLLYILTNVTASVAFSERAKLMFGGDAAQIAQRIASAELPFRIAIVTELITIVGVLVLVAGLYIILAPVDSNASRLALWWRLAENFVLAVALLPEFAMLAL